MEQEKLYLVCQECGEAFDEITTAKAHEPNGQYYCSTYELLPESEAFWGEWRIYGYDTMQSYPVVN